MQILTKKQVKYCRLMTQKSAAVEYCLGIEFQAKLFISDKFFAGDRQQQAIDYCQNQYLAGQGKNSYLLVSNAAGLTVWRADKIARIVGKQSPEDLIANLKLDNLLVELREICNTFPGEREDKSLWHNFKVSLAKLSDLEQNLESGSWRKPIESVASFNTVHRYRPFKAHLV